MTAGWCSRTVRAAVFAAVCVLLAALGHVLMSGSHVPGWALAVGFAATGAAGWCLGGRERGLPLVVAAVVAAQAALHSAFSLAGPMSRDLADIDMDHAIHMNMGHAADMDAHMDMDHTVHMDMSSVGRMDHMDYLDHMDHMGQVDRMDYMGSSMDGSSMDGGSSSLGMLAVHLLAALLCGLWLAYGEKAAFRILRAVAGRLVAPLRLLLALPATPDRPRIGVRRPRSARAPRLLLLVHTITSRGPPAVTAVG
ncbi:hypothetical protein ACFV0T_31680 [Streptomyces sp. NPDC059582]|uniref:hypothetical protein n=1 Tax=Streptomyces sp. NPDC059582 TaxID=3346875 RepID=UPI00368246A5